MRAVAARWVAHVVGGGSIALIIGSVVLAYLDRHASLPAGQQTWGFSYTFGEAVNIAVPAVGLVLASRRPANPIGWLFLAAGAALGLGAFWSAYGLRALSAAPGSLPAGRAAMWLSNWVWVIPFAALSFLFLLFPTGQLRSARWRPVAWFLAGSLVLVGIAALVSATLEWSHPFRQSGQSFTGLVTIILLAAMLVSVTALIVRFARSSGEERLQLKWFAAAATVVVVGLAATMLNNNSAVASVLSNLAFLCLWVSIGIAVLKYRLYEIDIVISRAVLYGSLAVFITAVYVGLVAGVGTLVGNRRSALLSALAAAVVAVAFQPLRHRAGRLANRVVYGRRATPYEVLSDFSRRVGGAYSSEDVLPRWHASWRPGPVPSRWSSGCGWATSCTPRPRHPARVRTPPRPTSRGTRCPPCPAPTEPATTRATPRWDQACGTWPTGSPRSAASSTSGPLPAAAPGSPGGSLSHPPAPATSA